MPPPPNFLSSTATHVLMPGGKTAVSKSFEPDGTLLETYQKDGGITLGEMQRCAENVLNMALRTNKGKNL